MQDMLSSTPRFEFEFGWLTDDEAGDDDEYDEYEDDEEEAEEVSDDDENEFGLPNFNRRGQPPPTNQVTTPAFFSSSHAGMHCQCSSEA